MSLLLPVSGYATLRLFERGGSLRRVGRRLLRGLRFKEEVRALTAERARLEAAILDAVERLKPADMVPLFPERMARSSE